MMPYFLCGFRGKVYFCTTFSGMKLRADYEGAVHQAMLSAR
jgi:hypothetical protein